MILEIKLGEVVVDHQADQFFQFADVDHGTASIPAETGRGADRAYARFSAASTGSASSASVGYFTRPW
jgi:hypothetical protein